MRRGGTALCLRIETETGEDAGGAGFRRMGVDIDKPHLDLGDAVGVACRLGFGKKRRALLVGGKYDLDQRVLGAGRFLRHLADPGVLRQRHRPAFGSHVAGDDAKQRRFAGAIAPHKASLRAGRQADARMVEKKAARDARGKVGNGDHAAGFG
jgi:hypothetical protein